MDTNTTLMLTEEQAKSLASGPQAPLIRVIDPTTNQEFVLMRAETYQHLQDLAYDASPWTPDEMLWLLGHSGRLAGWDDPLMDEYDDYDRIKNERQQR